RIDRRGIVGIDGDDVPLEAEVGAADLLGLVVGIDQLDALAPPARVHVRLKRRNPSGLVESRVAVAADERRAAGDVERLGRLCQRSESSNCRGFGASAGLPIGAPASTHLTIVSISSPRSDGSFLKRWMPTCGSMPQGGISRSTTRCLMARAQGRTS